MRMVPTRLLSVGKPPLQVKRAVSQIKHVSAPLKGLDLSSALTTGDPLTATVLTNFVVDEDRIRCRPGYRAIASMGGLPIERLMPYIPSGTPILLAGTGGVVRNAQSGTVISAGPFTSNDWHWTMFANLGQQKFLVLVNGRDGVYSFTGPSTWVHEAVTAPAGATHCVVNEMECVISHMNRLFFTDLNNLSMWYLPLQQKSGELKEIPMNAFFKRGGSIRAIASWSMDGGSGMDDRLVVFTTNGECLIWQGIDPENDFEIVGIYRFDAPMSKHCVQNYGGELYVQVSTGLLPMSTLMRAEAEQLGKVDRGVFTKFKEVSYLYGGQPGWMTILDNASGRIICNQPGGALNRYTQMVRKMPNPIWSDWSAIPARCWAWMDGRMFFGNDIGEVFEMGPQYYNDAGAAINVDVQPAWSLYNTPGSKQFKLIRAFILTDGFPRPYIDVRVDYDAKPPRNLPDTSSAPPGSLWDTSDWDLADWAQGDMAVMQWNGVAARGRVGAPRITASILDCTFSIAGFDVTFEAGSIL